MSCAFLNSGVMTLFFFSQSFEVLLILSKPSMHDDYPFFISLSLHIYHLFKAYLPTSQESSSSAVIFCASIHLAVTLTFFLIVHNHVGSWIILYVHQIIFTICTHSILVLVLQLCALSPKEGHCWQGLASPFLRYYCIVAWHTWMLSMILTRADSLLLGVASASISGTAAVGTVLLTWGSQLVLRLEATVFIVFIDVFPGLCG